MFRAVNKDYNFSLSLLILFIKVKEDNLRLFSLYSCSKKCWNIMFYNHISHCFDVTIPVSDSHGILHLALLKLHYPQAPAQSNRSVHSIFLAFLFFYLLFFLLLLALFLLLFVFSFLLVSSLSLFGHPQEGRSTKFLFLLFGWLWLTFRRAGDWNVIGNGGCYGDLHLFSDAELCDL